MNTDKTTQTATAAPEAPNKLTLYRTARALIGCAYFKSGDIVLIKYSGFCHCHGAHWFDATKDEENHVSYAMHQLTDFVL